MVHTTGTSLSAVPDLFVPSRMQAGHGAIAFSPGSTGSSVDFLHSLESALRFEHRPPPSADTPHDIAADRHRQDTSRTQDTIQTQDRTNDRVRSDETRRASDRHDDDAREARDAASKRLDQAERTNSERTEPSSSDRTTSSGEEGAAQQAGETESRESAKRKRSGDDEDAETAATSGSVRAHQGDDASAASGSRSAAAETKSPDQSAAEEDADAVGEGTADAARKSVLRTASDAATGQKAAGDGVRDGGDKASMAAAVGAVEKDASEDAEIKHTGSASAGRRAAHAAAGNGEIDASLEQNRAEDRVAVSQRDRAELSGDDAAEEDPAEGRERRGADAAEGSRRVRLDVRDLRTEAAREARAEGKSPEGSSPKIELDATVAGRRSDGVDGPARGAGGERPDLTPGRALREQLQPELVRHARLVVRGESSGDIRLTLRPEQLGRVRISLHLEDNRIAGRIIVENGSVRDAFQANVQALERALRDAGLETAGLEVTVGEGDSHEESSPHHGNRRRVARGFDEMVPQLTSWYDDSSRVSLYA